jgi:enterochelin esterase-like enzyme
MGAPRIMAPGRATKPVDMGRAGVRSSWYLLALLLLAAALVGCGRSLEHTEGDADLPADVAAPSEAPAEAVLDRSFYSAALGREMSTLVWLPPDYDAAPARRYPVLYLLHGLGGDNREWLGYGVDETAACLSAAGRIQPFLIVLPQGDEAYWLNHADDGPRWGDAVTADLVAYVDARYRTIPDRAGRAVGGLSMGGHGALQLAFNHPDVFGVAGAHSPTLRPRAEAPYYFADPATFAKVDPITLARRGDGPAQVRLWLDAGDADPWLGRIELLHETLDRRGVAHTWQVWEGDHESEYWTAHVADYLAFYSQTLAGEKPSGLQAPPGAPLDLTCGKPLP